MRGGSKVIVGVQHGIVLWYLDLDQQYRGWVAQAARGLIPGRSAVRVISLVASLRGSGRSSSSDNCAASSDFGATQQAASAASRQQAWYSKTRASDKAAAASNEQVPCQMEARRVLVMPSVGKGASAGETTGIP
jgi:hypothetical protein